jgi:protein ImuB
MRLSAVDRKATALGLSIGMPLANARAMLPVLDVRIADEPEDRALLERIADWCGRFTPFVALDPPHSLLLDVTGAAHLFGDEKAMLNRMRADLSQQGFTIRAALAGSAAAAWPAMPMASSFRPEKIRRRSRLSRSKRCGSMPASFMLCAARV